MHTDSPCVPLPASKGASTPVMAAAETVKATIAKAAAYVTIVRDISRYIYIYSNDLKTMITLNLQLYNDDS